MNPAQPSNPEQRLRQRALDLQLDALLSEAAGVLPAPDLIDRVRVAVLTHSRPAALSRHLLLAAALLALAVVGTLAWWRNSERAAFVPVQEPGPVVQEPVPQDPKTQDPKTQEPKTQDSKPAPLPSRWVTVVADYSENTVMVVDEKARVIREVDDVFGAWDAEMLANGNLLIAEFSISRVREIDPQGNIVWRFEGLKNPYDADRLANGNTLIADTFGGRVIEVSPKGEIVWEFLGTRPFDADRLPNGNTLIADVLKDQVIEVAMDGQIVWQVRDLPAIHDADRLANGNTLVTLRAKGEVIEIDNNGKIVWELTGLSSPSDADRLPNGNTLVAENTTVREFDVEKKVVWQMRSTWAVEANRYYLAEKKGEETDDGAGEKKIEKRDEPPAPRKK